MKNKLIVVEPFALLNIGDELIWNKEEQAYVAEYDERELSATDKKNFKSTYYSKYSISEDYAKMLIKEGFLKEDTSAKNDAQFKNVFDEIEKLRNQYTYELDALHKNPNLISRYEAIEKETVLSNLITVLDYLKTLRK